MLALMNSSWRPAGASGRAEAARAREVRRPRRLSVRMASKSALQRIGVLRPVKSVRSRGSINVEVDACTRRRRGNGILDMIEQAPSDMLAARLHGVGLENLRVERVPVPQPNDNQLLARVDAAGVCSSTLKLIAQGSDHTFLNGWDLTRFPIQLGDEGCVTIVAVGKNLDNRFAVGQRYCIQPAVDHPPINHCERYRDGGKGMTKVAVGYTLPGHLAQYILVTEEVIAAGCLLPLPDQDMPYFAAGLAEPISCVISAQDRHLHIHQRAPDAPREPKLGLLQAALQWLSAPAQWGACMRRQRCVTGLGI